MKVYCCYTEAHEPLLRDYFLPSISNDVEIIAIRLDISGDGDFLSSEFIDCIQRKMVLIQESLQLQNGGIILWADIDIIFFKDFAREIERYMEENQLDIAFQKEGFGPWEGEVNTGFIAMRCNDKTRQFYKKVETELKANPEKNEQPVINELLEGKVDLKWAMLPVPYVARSHGWPPADEMVLYHANVTAGKSGVQQKIEQFSEVREIRGEKNRKICVVSPEVSGPRRNSGIGTHTMALLKMLGKLEGIDVTFLLSAEVNVSCDESWEKWFKRKLNVNFVHLEPQPHPYREVGWFNHWFNMRSLQIFNHLRYESFEVVFFQDLNGDGFVCHQARETGLAFEKTVFTTTINGPAKWAREGMKHFVGNEAYESLLNFVESYPLEKSDIVIAPSQYAFDYVENEAEWKIASERRICPYMLNLPENPGLDKEKGKPAIIFFGRLETRKGIHLFLGALGFLQRKQPDGVPRHAVFIGNHSETPHGNSSDVIPQYFSENLPGWTYEIHSEWDQPECIEYLSTHKQSVVVLPSIAETLGYVAIECIGLGLNVIGANTGAFPAVFADKSRLFENHPRAIAEKVIEAFDGKLPPASSPYNPEEARKGWKDALDHCLELVEERKNRIPSRFSEQPLVSMCLPFFNYGKYIEEQVDSIAAQTYRNFELILIDDGSTEKRSIEVLKGLKKRYSDDPRFRFYDQKNQGLCQTRNRAASLAKGDLLVFCDADNICKPSMLESFVRAMRVSGADCVTCHFEKFRIDGEGNRIQLDHYTPVGGCVEAGPYVDPFGDANSIMKKSVFEAIGGFRHVPFTASEDWEFFAELVLSGYRLEVIPSDLFLYREHPESNMRITNFYDTRSRTLYPYLRRMEGWQRRLLENSVGAWEVKIWEANQRHQRELNLHREISLRDERILELEQTLSDQSQAMSELKEIQNNKGFWNRLGLGSRKTSQREK